jgi:hypothetical protein
VNVVTLPDESRDAIRDGIVEGGARGPSLHVAIEGPGYGSLPVAGVLPVALNMIYIQPCPVIVVE